MRYRDIEIEIENKQHQRDIEIYHKIEVENTQHPRDIDIYHEIEIGVEDK